MAAAGWIVVASVSRPIGAMTGAMQACRARSDNRRDRKDEIGAMAAAVQVFKDAMITADWVAAEQATGK